MIFSSNGVKQLISESVVKLDVGCGAEKCEGFIGMDSFKYPGIDIVHDPEKYPWPIPDHVITLISCAHFIHRIDRENQGFLRFMNEAWRVLKYGGQLRIATPFGTSHGFVSDPCAVNPTTAITWQYFEPLAASKLYRKYEPAPWKIEHVSWSTDGLMEVLLSKRRDDPSYHLDKKIKYK